MSILNKYKDCQLKLIVNRSNIMDIVVSDDVTTVSQTVDYGMGSLIKDNLIAYINASVNNEETETSYVQSLEDYFYKEWTNSDENICLLDDELTAYDNRMLTIDEDRTINDNCGHFLLTKQDKFLKLYPITNDEETVEFSNDSIIFNGGFLQGYYKLFGFDYNTLPLYIENDEWNLEFLIKPQKQRDDEGIFFYMGTRAENKFANFYNTKETTDGEKTSNGVLLDKDNYYEIKTNNKYLPEIITGYTREYNTNLGNNAYLIFSQNSKDYTVDTIEEFYKSDKYNKPKYNILNDLYYNCFSLFVTNDGEIGYRYLVNNCKDSFAENFIVETTNKNTINFNEWSTVNVKIKISSTVGECNEQMKQHIMKIYIYVNGYLRFISKELPEFNFRKLDDIYQKQEMVPYNISIGGGTLGLSESKLVFKDKIFELEDPGYISTYFNKRFYGKLKTFKFYNGILTINDIRNNYTYNTNIINNVVSNVTINGPSVVVEDEEFTMSVFVEPSTCEDVTISWEVDSNMLEIVDVSENTLSCIIRALNGGNTSVRAYVKNNNKVSDTFEILVEDKPEVTNILYYSGVLNEDINNINSDNIKTELTELRFETGVEQEIQIQLPVLDDNAAWDEYDEKVIFDDIEEWTNTYGFKYYIAIPKNYKIVVKNGLGVIVSLDKKENGIIIDKVKYDIYLSSNSMRPARSGETNTHWLTIEIMI